MERKNSTSSKGIPLDPDDNESYAGDQNTWIPDQDKNHTVTHRTDHELIPNSNRLSIDVSGKELLEHRDLSVRVARNIEMGEIFKPVSVPQVYMSITMMQLRKVLDEDDSTLFERLCV